MKLAEKLLPAGYKFRELWLPQNIIPNSSLPGSVQRGHSLTLTGAQLGSTVNGLWMRGAELITILDHADISITDNLTVVLPAFVLRGTFPSDYAADMGLMNLNNGAVIARLNHTTGALDFIFHNVHGLADLTVSTTKVSWAANTVWQVAFTFKNNGIGVISVRLYINGVAENTSDQVDSVITVPVGNTFIGEDLTTFFTGKLQRMCLIYDTTILTATQLLQIYNGIPYVTNLKAYLPLDHPGRGLTLPDRSAGGNCSGTISGTVIGPQVWDFEGHPKLAVLNLDGRNDSAFQASASNISGDISVVWAGKMGSTYSDVGNYKYFFQFYIDANNSIEIACQDTGTAITFYCRGTGIGVATSFTPTWSIGDYIIMVDTLTAAGNMQLLSNGLLVATGSGVGKISASLASVYIGRDNTGIAGRYDVSKPILVGLIDGALSINDGIKFTRNIDKQMRLGLGI